MKLSKGCYQYEYKGIVFDIEKINGLWTIYYQIDEIDNAIFNWEKDNDRTHALKIVSQDKAKQYIDELL